MDSDEEEANTELLAKRRQLSTALLELPYDLLVYLDRAIVHSDLGYPDLAAGDAYRALLLVDEVRNENFEYHDQALEALRAYPADHPAVCRKDGIINIISQMDGVTLDGPDATPHELAARASIRCYQILSISLLLCGCLKSAYDFCTRGLVVAPNDEELLETKSYIQTMARRRMKVDDFDINDLPDQGVVRREIYPWNEHEPDRFSSETLEFLNAELASVGPKCVVQVTELPTLLENASDTDGSNIIPTNKQLGLFAIDDVSPGETVLDEFTVLTANNRLKLSLCDTCCSKLPSLGAEKRAIGCEYCEDIMFCSEECFEQAQNLYHPAVCDKDVDTIAKDPDPKETPNALYLLLLARALAMSATQESHPLDLKEVKYIWGDFLPVSANYVSSSPNAEPPPIWTLPFSFAANISGPLHVLEKMDIDIFSSVDSYDLWVFNTLYSKFRGTASARVSTYDGRPEVAAVHPLWCLANHDCDPNVQWEWGGRMKLWAREKRIEGGREPGIRKGEEILNHYCDIELPVKERRAWAKGSLGGWCMCERCRREAKAEEESQRLRN